MPERPVSRRAAASCLLATAALAGCAGVPFPGSSCGPGDTEIGSIDGTARNISIEGEFTDIRDGAVVVDDGTASETGESEQDVVMVAANLSTT